MLFNDLQFLGVLTNNGNRRFLPRTLDQMIDLAHPLAVPTTRMPWAEIEAALSPAFAHKDRTGREVEDANLFGTTMQLAGAGVTSLEISGPLAPDVPGTFRASVRTRPTSARDTAQAR
jgi:hypothetical protein